jgi:phage shock protein E
MKTLKTNKGMNMKLILFFFIIVLFTLMAQSKELLMKHNINEEIQLNIESRIVKTLSSPSFKLIGLGFKKGQVLEKHNTPTAAVLIVHHGSVDFKMSGKTHLLKAGDYFEIPANTEHEVVGNEDSHLFLIK